MINFYNETRHKLSREQIARELKLLFITKNIDPDSSVSVALVGEHTMLGLAKKYLNEEGELAKAHPVLSFPTGEIETSFFFPPDIPNYLGEIIISYPKVVAEAKANNQEINSAIFAMLHHGALHLLGIHHD